MLVVAATIPAETTFALITGGEGNKPIPDPGWPAGAVIVFDQPGRVAYWEGPPFGGGQWHAECRGDANALNAVLANFAKIDAKTKRLVVHDGVGHSFWLNPNNEPPKAAIARIDWVFVVWQTAGWKPLRKLSPALRQADMGDDKTGPPTQVEVYTGSNVHWADVIVPKGIKVIDDRLEAHGVTPADGTVLEGTITDLETTKSLAGRVELQLIDSQKKGGYRYSVLAEAAADAQGHWVLKHAPVGWVRIVLLADGYVPRVVGYAKHDGEPGWHAYNGALLRPAAVSGRVADDAGKPLADVNIRLTDLTSHGESYNASDEFNAKTGADGRFHFDQVPTATARVMLSKTGYCHPGLGPTIDTPASDVELTMKQAAKVKVTVEFADAKRPEGYMVDIEPKGGNVVGSWGGSSRINKENIVTFNDVPPGRYILRGHPNPHSPKQVSEPIPIDLQGGVTEEITLNVK